MENCAVPANATWVFRKIVEARKFILQLNGGPGNVTTIMKSVVKNGEVFY